MSCCGSPQSTAVPVGRLTDEEGARELSRPGVVPAEVSGCW